MLTRTLDITKLSWNYRLAFINFYKPTDDQIMNTFRVSLDDLILARQLERDGSLTADRHVDVERVGNIFDRTDRKVVITFKTPSKKATRKKKRGRKGEKISEAFKHVPLIPTNAYNFTEQYQISLPVLRQAKRFDEFVDEGRVIVKQIINPATGKKELMVWRQPEQQGE